MNVTDKKALLLVLKKCFDDEIAHLELRLIRDEQAPRFDEVEKLDKDLGGAIKNGFLQARNGPHEILLKNRRERVNLLTKLIEE